MSTLEYTVYSIRRGWRFSKTFIFAGVFAAAVVAGSFAGLLSEPLESLWPPALLVTWSLMFASRIKTRFFDPYATSKTSRRAELEIGLLLVVGVHGVIQVAGGLDSPLYPLVYVLVAFLVVYTPQWIGFALVAAAIGIEAALMINAGPDRSAVFTTAVHAVFIVFFAVINFAVTRSEVARTRLAARREIEAKTDEIEREAHDFRLTAPAQGQTGILSRQDEQTRISVAGVKQVRNAMYQHVDLLKKTMGLHTCVVLWLDARGELLRILECASETDAITRRRIEKGAGVLGAVLQGGRPLRLKGLRRGYGGLPYYEEPTCVTDFLGVPISENGSARGVLCADRCGDRAFDAADAEILLAAAESLLSILSNERVFAQLQKAKSEQSKLLVATDLLSQALTEKDVVKAALEAAAQIAEYDVAAVALAGEGGKQKVLSARGQGAEQLSNLELSPNSSLAFAALKNRHFLPYRAQLDPRTQIVFSKKTQKVFGRMTSAMVLPLVSGEVPLGTLVLASEKVGIYTEQVRTTLQVLSNQLGAALLNAKMVRRLEEMATTDGLTGLPNHRTFQEELDKKLASANRFGAKLSVILCDVDKFKNVNDTYGHPVGDQVLRGLGQTLRRNVVRDTDLAARYGGEEFVIVCEGTDTQGAVNLAERVRKDLESQIFATDQGELRCTISMGVATFPEHGRTKEELIEKADTALYAAKEGGRNQVRTWNRP